MSAYKLVYIFRVSEVANLAAGVDPMHRLASQCVPKPYTSISSSSTTAHGTVLMWVPSDSLYCGQMLAELHQRFLVIGSSPDHQFIIIAS